MKTQAQRVLHLISELGLTPKQFSKKLGFTDSSLVDSIINEDIEINEVFLNAMIESEFDLNIDWIVYGNTIGVKNIPVFKTVTHGEHGDEYFSDGIIVYPARLAFQEVKILAKGFANVLFDYREETRSYTVKARPSGVEGLEFEFETFEFEGGEKGPMKQYSVLVTPEWKICESFDFWRTRKKTRRGQNILTLTDDNLYLKMYETEISKILEDLGDHYFEHYSDEDLIKNQPKDKNGFINIFSTDSRCNPSKKNKQV